MHKLTAGIFAGILTIVTVNAARADIATTSYVTGGVNAAKAYADTEVGKVNTKVGDLATLATTAKGNTVAAINEVNTKAVNALTDAKAYTDELKNGVVAANEAAIAVLNGGAEDNGSVAYQIAEAVMDVSSDISTLNETVTGLKTSKADASTVYTKTEIDNTVTTINTSIADAKRAGTDASAHADELNTAMDARMDSAEVSIASLTTGENSVASQIKTAVDTAKGEIKETTDDLDTRVTANTTAIETLNGTGATSVTGKINAAVATINTTTSGLNTRLTDAEGEIDVLQGATAGYNATNTVASAVADAKKAGTDVAAALNTYKTAQAATDKTQSDAISALEAKVGDNNVSEQLATKMDLATGTENKLLTTNAKGQVIAATASNTCDANAAKGESCMMVSDGNGGFRFEKIVDTYSE